MRLLCLLGCLSLTVSCASVCPEGSTPSGDRCVIELGATDAGPRMDAGRVDAGPPVDSGPLPDAGPPVDAGPDVDAGPMNDAGPDAGPPDSGPRPDAGPPSCVSGSTCFAPVPSDWTGPVSIGEGAVNPPPCPSSYPTERETLNRGLTAQPASCTCGCSVGTTNCDLLSTITGDEYFIGTSCVAPLRDNDCLEASASANCTPNPSSTVPPPTWAAAARSCEGGTPAATCSGGGTCYPAAAAGQRLCITRAGDHPCPAPFADRTLYQSGINDNRGCSTCSCSGSGAACTIRIEVCSVGIYERDLSSAAGTEECLPPPSDGDSVGRLSTNIDSSGSCSPNGGNPIGTATTTGPQTYCCLF